MMAWTFRGGNKYEQPTLTMHSRVSYIAYIGGADLALCHVLAREISDRIGVPVEDFAFTWSVDSLQFHSFKSIPYLFRFGLDDILRKDSKRYPSAKHPTLKLVRRWWKSMDEAYQDGKPLDAEKYGPWKRIRRRYEEYHRGEFVRSTPIEDLNFNALRR
jgi:hypothetical protein